MKDTRTDLVRLLEQLEASAERDAVIARAARGEFHDYQTESATPKHDLTQALFRLGNMGTLADRAKLSAIAVAVMHGEYDETPDVHDLDRLREMFADDPDTLRVIEQTIRPKAKA